MKKTQLTAVVVLVVVAIIVAGQALAGWGPAPGTGARRAGRGQDNDHGVRSVYPERWGPMAQGGPGRVIPDNFGWERGAPGPDWEGRGPRWGQRPYAQRTRPNREAGRNYDVCPHCGARLGAGPGTRNDVGPWRGRGPRIGTGVGQGQNFRQGQWDSRQRNMGRGDIAERRRLPRDRWEQGHTQPYGDEQGIRRGDAQRPDWGRMNNGRAPQRRGMNRQGPDGFRPVRPEDEDYSGLPGPPQGRRWLRPQGTPGNQPELPPQKDPQIEAPVEGEGPQTEQ